jgi:hypothetical protein
VFSPNYDTAPKIGFDFCHTLLQFSLQLFSTY